jgi:hypothetical protein
MQNMPNILNPLYEDYVATDAKARAFVQQQLQS